MHGPGPSESPVLGGKTMRGSYDHDIQENGTEAAEAPQEQLSDVRSKPEGSPAKTVS